MSYYYTPFRHNRTALSLLLILTNAIMTTVTGKGWVDIDTPLDKRTTTSLIDGTEYNIVMSDEFNVDGRSFADGHDPMWTALDRSDDDASSAGGGSMQFYNSSSITTVDGRLQIRTYLERTSWHRFDHVNKTWKHEIKNFTSGMLQTWNKFCFTGGIIEVDVQFPGDPSIGGLWPAVWMMGNLGRATYEASTNNLWPWSYDICDRDLQQAQAISACNRENHYGMNPYQGRGATEIDIVEVMCGYSKEPLQAPKPHIYFPYADFTLQVAPGISRNRPQPGGLPNRHAILSSNGHTQFQSQEWYDNVIIHGNTSINPYFYGTYLAETKPNEPVSRSKKQAFQADAVGVVHQLMKENFQQTHTFRIEWQPGPGGRLDWFVKRPKESQDSSSNDASAQTTENKSDASNQSTSANKNKRTTKTTAPTASPTDTADAASADNTTDSDNSTDYDATDDGMEGEWLHAFGLKDESLKGVIGSQIPNEPTYLIMNTAISSTWGFPWDTPSWCPKCYDCGNPTCSCAFAPGFCSMLEKGDVAMYVDSVRVYQSNNDDAHVGNPHTLGCDPPGYPTKEWINGHTYRYMRNPPFSYSDTDPLRKIQRGGGGCKNDTDCGSDVHHVNLTAVYEKTKNATLVESLKRRLNIESDASDVPQGRGRCVDKLKDGMFSSRSKIGPVCKCNDGFTGPHCLAIDFKEKFPSAHEMRQRKSPFHKVRSFEAPHFMIATILVMAATLLVFLFQQVSYEKKARVYNKVGDLQKRSVR